DAVSFLSRGRGNGCEPDIVRSRRNPGIILGPDAVVAETKADEKIQFFRNFSGTSSRVPGITYGSDPGSDIVKRLSKGVTRMQKVTNQDTKEDTYGTNTKF